MSVYFSWNTLLLGLLATSICINLLFIFRKKKILKFDQSEYAVSLDALKILLSRYSAILAPVIDHLRSQYDTDPESKTSAIVTFSEELDKLYTAHVKIVINDYLSDDLRRILVKYLSDNGMVLYILMNLKGQGNE